MTLAVNAEPVDWARGDTTGLDIPAHPDALREGGAAFLTRAFIAFGALQGDDAVEQIVAAQDCEGGSTGRKLRLRVRYRDVANRMPEQLFVKFSRDFGDLIRDQAKIQMASEVRMALLSRQPGFPVAVPRSMFADYEQKTGTGILIAEEIAFGEHGIEPHREKCLDADLADPIGHYRALIRANARLAAAHRAGAFPAAAITPFSDGRGALGVSDRPPYSADQLRRRIDRLREFAARYSALLPEELRSSQFLDRFEREALRFCGHETAIAAFLDGTARYNALCHWNANIDNAWFWRDSGGELQCGLLDWGNARVMNMGVALAGSVMAAEADFLVSRLDELVQIYVTEFKAECGEALDPDELKMHLFLHNACSGLLWLIDAPAMILRACPGLEIGSRFDRRFRDSELPRTQLQMLTNFLSLWQRFNFADVLDRFLKRQVTSLS